MGSWGTGISSNDTAMDLRSEYQAAFFYYDVETALLKIDAYVRSEGFDESDEGEWCDYYYSLADFMWKKGILTNAVKTRALEMIDSGFGLDVWAESGKSALKERKKVLEKFREKLFSEQPSKKKIRINLYLKPILEIGDVVAFQLQTMDKSYLPAESSLGWMRSRFDEAFFRSCHGKWVVMRKVYDIVSYSSAIVPQIQDIWPCFQLYAAVFDDCPAMEMLKDTPLVNVKHNVGDGVFYTEGSLSYLKKRNYRIIGSSFDDIDKRESGSANVDAFFFSSSSESYNADTVILNAIIGSYCK